MELEPCLFVIFGGTGDLARRKLLPALCRLLENERVPDRLQVVGVGLEPYDDASFRQSIAESLGVREGASSLVSRLHYAPLAARDPDYQALNQRLDAIAEATNAGPNRVFYLALPPQAFAPTLDGLGAAGFGARHGHTGTTRVVIEKPFGHDLRSAQALNETIHAHFSEKEVYRIDHYLGKETVQNLLSYRFANAMIESSWNRDRIDAVQILVAEDLGVGTRAGYYDRSGALRDMVQNHLMQLMTLVAMEPPTAFRADPIRREKIKVLESIEPVRPECIVRGQYTRGVIEGEEVCGYLEEEGIPPQSTTDSFVALELYIDNWRWKGVPFYLRTGKRLPRKSSQIAIRYRDAPVRFFESLGCTRDTSDILLITLQPSEGFTFHLDIKVPGEPFELRRIPMRFAYSDLGMEIPDAYETLLLDVLEGDQTLFVHAEETERSWKLIDPLFDSPEAPKPYAAGTWGPPEADSFAIPDVDVWQTRPTEFPLAMKR